MKPLALAALCVPLLAISNLEAEELLSMETSTRRAHAVTEHPKPAAVTELPTTVAPALPPSAVSQVPGQPGIYEAVLAGDQELVAGLLNEGYSPNEITPEKDTPLCLALRSGQPAMAIFLLLHGADPNMAGADGQTPVALASLRRHPFLLKALLAAGGNPNKPFSSPVSSEIIKSVGDEFLRWQLKREKNITPLMACSGRGDVEAVTLLLEYGANKQAHTMPSYRYAINFAADQRYLYVMRILLGRQPESEPHILVTVDLSNQKAWVEIEGVRQIDTKISTGRAGYRTPAGRYVITNKYKDWTSTIYKVPMPYFMRLNCSSIGLHSGYVTGRPASHGCIRLPYEIAKKVFGMVRVGDEVHIIP